jgi:hypothetical protein
MFLWSLFLTWLVAGTGYCLFLGSFIQVYKNRNMINKIMREFQFYLDAWKFCVENQISLQKIVKKDFKTWIIVE